MDICQVYQCVQKHSSFTDSIALRVYISVLYVLLQTICVFVLEIDCKNVYWKQNICLTTTTVHNHLTYKQLLIFFFFPERSSDKMGISNLINEEFRLSALQFHHWLRAAGRLRDNRRKKKYCYEIHFVPLCHIAVREILARSVPEDLDRIFFLLAPPPPQHIPAKVLR